MKPSSTRTPWWGWTFLFLCLVTIGVGVAFFLYANDVTTPERLHMANQLRWAFWGLTVGCGFLNAMVLMPNDSSPSKRVFRFFLITCALVVVSFMNWALALSRGAVLGYRPHWLFTPSSGWDTQTKHK